MVMVDFAPISSHAVFKKMIVLLLTLSIFLIGWHHMGGASRDMVVSVPDWRFEKVDDSLQGGETEVSMVEWEDGASIGCRIVNVAPYPFCEIAMFPQRIGEAIDLSKYHSVSLNIDYHTLMDDARVRVYLRNSHPAYTRDDDPVSYKFNAIEFSPGVNRGPVTIPLNAFHVLSWWIADYNIDLEHSGPDLSNIVHIEVATGSYVEEGEYTLSVRGITFHGYWISEQELYKLIMAMWIISAICFLCYEYFIVRYNFQVAAKREALLRKNNITLSLQAKKFAALAERDTLTGVKNRAAVQEWLHQAVKQSQRYERPFSIIFIDIDHFKVINDTHGHYCGDDILRAFSHLVVEWLDINDVFVRWGREEFIIFCPNRALQSATDLAETLRYQVENFQWTNDTTITISAGVAQLEDETPSELIQRADEALYKAKRTGRNRVTISSPYRSR